MKALIHNGKQVNILHDGKLVVMFPVDYNKIIVPFHCPMCEYPMKTAEDAQSYREVECCSMCQLYWASSKIVPDKTSERWKTYMERRHLAFLPQIQLK